MSRRASFQRSEPVGARLLVVEDDDAFREMLRAALTAAGFNVRVVAHGADALLALHREIPNVVLLDLVLPLVNGIEVLRTMRRLPHMTVFQCWS